MSEGPIKLLQQVRRRVQAVTYGNPLYNLMLDQGPVPDRVRPVTTDPWPGDADAGLALINNQRELFETGAPHLHVPSPAKALRDLRAVGSDGARKRSVALLQDWVDDLENWDEASWAPDVIGERLSSWISFYDFYAPALPPEFIERLMVCMVRQLRHLLRVMPVGLTGVAALNALKGLVFGGLGLLEGERALAVALEILQRQILVEILPDGGHISRNPSEQLHMLRGLIDIRSALRAARLEVPHALQAAIERMVPALKLFRHGDGALGLFHGSTEENPLWIDAAITLAETRSRVLRRLPQTGYERVSAGRTLLLVDAAAPPPRAHDDGAHAGLLAFEFSVGRERLIVNCGAAPMGNAEWRMACAATAAHSTLALDDVNACEILPDGGVGQRAREVIVQRFEQDGMQFVEMVHDGYAHNLGVMYQRSLALASDGDELRGTEMISGAANHDFSLRWHLHPSVQASLGHGGQTALLRTASGAGWRLRAGGGDLGLEPSIYCGGNLPRRSLQLRLSGRTRGEVTQLNWVLSREKKG